ncbi:PAS domain-containing protein [Streptomyces sp. NPDC003077]|uniref:PAS domain-containing protein n=1 Tax=Streptomyces sp. NPDC003077 TaxID=3154443 RepID=UPI0033A2FD46
MSGAEQVEAELKDFRRRVEELRAARALPSQERLSVLDTALFELQHVVDVFLPRFEQRIGEERENGVRRANDEQHLLRALFQRLPLAVALLGPDAVIRRLNFAGTRLFGMRAGYATGRPLTASFSPEVRAAFRSQVAAVARNEGDRSLVVRMLPAPDGSQRAGESLRVTMTALRPPGEPGTSVLAAFHTGVDTMAAGAAPGHPGTPRRVPRPGLSEVTRNAELMDLLDDMTSALLEPARDSVALLERAARVLRGRFADWVIVDVVTRGGGPLRRVTVLGPGNDRDTDGTGGPEDADPDKDAPCGLLAAVLGDQEPARCPLVAEVARSGNANLQVRPEDLGAYGYDPDGVPILARAVVSSLLCVPLRSKTGPVRGVLTLFRTGGRRAFSMAEAGVLDRISRHLGLVLQF